MVALSLLIYSSNSKEPADCQLKGSKIMWSPPILMFYLDKRERGGISIQKLRMCEDSGVSMSVDVRESQVTLLPLCLEFTFLVVRLPNIYDLDVIHKEKELAWSYYSLVILRKKF